MVEVTATTGLGGLLRQLKAFKGREKVDYRISGRLVTGNFGGIDFDQTGEVELPKDLGEAGGGRARRRSSERWADGDEFLAGCRDEAPLQLG